MTIRAATILDIHGWVELRAQLWGDTSWELHCDEAKAMLAKSPHDCIVFLDVADGSEIRGFAEASVRHDHVNGCETSPVAFLEGIFVRREYRCAGVGRRLLASVEFWAQERGCLEFASDAHLNNAASHAFHAAVGFDESDRVVYFRKAL